FRTGVIRHLQRLLRVAMRSDVRVVRANRHASEFERPFAVDIPKTAAHRGVPAENDFLATTRNDVPVISALRIVTPPRSPMPHLECFHLQIAVICLDILPFTPAKLRELLDPSVYHQVTCVLRRDSELPARQRP